jgi:hypothetical protein
LLGDDDMRVVNTALENSRLTEAMVAKALLRCDSRDSLADAVGRNGKWSLRPEIQLALKRRAEQLAESQPAPQPEI